MYMVSESHIRRNDISLNKMIEGFVFVGEDGTYGDTEVSLSDNAIFYSTGDNVAEYEGLDGV